ncbi:MAG TPA: hemolysin family protein [Desulfovibrio sp.]|jgi:putative hemolysin|uniref:hemolysin family protein n=1 Tax=Desulfovibrio TaxID=872 RepID=UPI002A4AA6E0|nr:hemolysin family protein [Desulfovibrio sp.]MDY0304840.1 hemolysin family protein [Desulfovibrionaceae bacterium]HMM39696.1 hemolysin family protein [Desulfovibrio sp.]
MNPLYLEMAAILFLILLNGFFSMAEMALVSSRAVRLRNMAGGGDRRARLALDMRLRPERFLSTVQIGITVVGVLTGVYGGATLVTAATRLLVEADMPVQAAEALAVALVVASITFLTLVLGELAPKRLALRRPERLAAAAAPLMRLLMTLCLPLVQLLSLSTNAVLRVLGVSGKGEAAVTEEDIRGLIAEGAKSGVLEDSERDMIERIFRLGDRRVEAIMTHRSRVAWIDLDAPAEENLRTILEQPYGRFPAARGELEDVLGVVRARDVLTAGLAGGPADIAAHVRPALFAPTTMHATRLLEIFRQRPGMHFAVVVDEYGVIQGIVTLYDILEAIVGDIPTPGAPPEPSALRREDGSLLMDALLPMDEALDVLETRLSEEDGGPFRTLAGFVLHHLGRPPALGDRFRWKGFEFEIVDLDGARIDKLLVTPPPDQDGDF